jgi:hypothetical protein
MSAEWHKYINGQEMLAGEFNTIPGARVFGENVWADHKIDEATAQIPLPGFEEQGFTDVVWRKVHPVHPPIPYEQQHLAEVRPLKNGVTRVIEGFDNSFEGMRITEIKKNLEAISEGAI